jgi:hypothetical protein
MNAMKESNAILAPALKNFQVMKTININNNTIAIKT